MSSFSLFDSQEIMVTTRTRAYFNWFAVHQDGVHARSLDLKRRMDLTPNEWSSGTEIVTGVPTQLDELAQKAHVLLKGRNREDKDLSQEIIKVLILDENKLCSVPQVLTKLLPTVLRYCAFEELDEEEREYLLEEHDWDYEVIEETLLERTFKSLYDMIDACQKDLRDYIESALDTQRELEYIREMNSGELYPI